MTDVDAVRQQLPLELRDDRVGLGAVDRHRLVEHPVDLGRLDVGEERPLPDALEVVGEEIDDAMTHLAEFPAVHA